MAATVPSRRPKVTLRMSRATAWVGGGLAGGDSPNRETRMPSHTVRSKVVMAFMPRMLQCVPDVTTKEMETVRGPMDTGMETTR